MCPSCRSRGWRYWWAMLVIAACVVAFALLFMGVGYSLADDCQRSARVIQEAGHWASYTDHAPGHVGRCWHADDSRRHDRRAGREKPRREARHREAPQGRSVARVDPEALSGTPYYMQPDVPPSVGVWHADCVSALTRGDFVAAASLRRALPEYLSKLRGNEYGQSGSGGVDLGKDGWRHRIPAVISRYEPAHP